MTNNWLFEHSRWTNNTFINRWSRKVSEIDVMLEPKNIHRLSNPSVAIWYLCTHIWIIMPKIFDRDNRQVFFSLSFLWSRLRVYCKDLYSSWKPFHEFEEYDKEKNSKSFDRISSDLVQLFRLMYAWFCLSLCLDVDWSFEGKMSSFNHGIELSFRQSVSKAPSERSSQVQIDR